MLRCEFCGDEETWCLDADDVVWVRCENDACRRRRFRQMDAFGQEEPSWPEGVLPGTRGGDARESLEQNRTNTESR